ncbi:MAG: DUF3291 domain-containing protein [Bryobacteraceae bacterium]|nr:DUF3291 domain-containing protein [Bryobacteraceae bacterium]
MSHRLAELNIARLLHPIDDPRIQEFVEGLAPINALAEQSPGFVWRFQTASGNATDAAHPWSTDPFMLVNLSVWESPEALKEYVYRSNHLDYYLKRAQWFEKPKEAHYVLWWVPAGHIPTLAEAEARLLHYRAHGPTEHAFWFGKLFSAPASAAAAT